MKSKIEWTEHTWNITSGCTKVSSGCKNCYAERLMATRLKGVNENFILTDEHGLWSGIVSLNEDKFSEPLRRKKPTTYFVCSQSDLFHESVPFEFIDKAFAIMALCPQHTFMILTKRPERMKQYLAQRNTPGTIARSVLNLDPCTSVNDWQELYAAQCRLAQWCDFEGLTDTARWIGPWPLNNVWLGTSVENQKAADERIPHLLACPASKRFLSCEPLLGSVDLTCFPAAWVCKGCGARVLPSECTYWEKHDTRTGGCGADCYPEPGIELVIVGGESGPNARPMHPNWARSLRDQCREAGVPFYMKQIVENGKKLPFDEFPDDLQVREWPE